MAIWIVDATVKYNAQMRGQRPSASEVRCTSLLALFFLKISKLALDLARAKHAFLS
jgi:hypothetical protein